MVLKVGRIVEGSVVLCVGRCGTLKLMVDWYFEEEGTRVVL